MNRVRLIYSILPAVIFAAVYECVFTLLIFIFQSAALYGGGSFFAYVMAEEADLRALFSVIGMGAGFLPVMRIAKDEIRNGEKSFQSNFHVSEYSGQTSYQSDSHVSEYLGQTSYQSDSHVSGYLGRIFYITVFAGAICLSIGMNFLLELTGLANLAPETASGMQTSLMMGVLCYGIFTPYIEECVFRGIVFYRLHVLAEGSLKAAAVISSLLFGLYHGNLTQLMYAFVMGVLFCYVYVRTGRLMQAYLLHAACNLTVLFGNHLGWMERMCTFGWTAALLGISVLCFYTAFHNPLERKS